MILTVLPKQLAKLSVQPEGAKVNAGESAEVVVKVARQSEYGGPFRVELVAPPDVRGIEADAVTIPPGKDEAKLVIRAGPDVAKGSKAALIVRATGLFLDRTAIVQEAKLTLNVGK